MTTPSQNPQNDTKTTDQNPKLDDERAQERAEVLDKAQRAHDVAQTLRLTTVQKNELLHHAAEALVKSASAIIEANDKDVAAGRERGMPEALIDRLVLDEDRIEGIADGLRQVAALPDPVGDIVRGSTLPNGLELKQVRVPLGVMGMVYEARPNVTVDAFGLALKSGNVALLRGSKSAVHSNSALVDVLRQACADQDVPEDAVQLLPCTTHDSVQDLITARGLVDIVIPRGGAGLINAVVTGATVPTIETGTGNCHFYVHKDADLADAIAMVINGKTRRCSVCNATETVLLDGRLPDEDKVAVLKALQNAGVTIHGRQELRDLGVDNVVEAEEKDWTSEYLSMDIAAAIVPDEQGAVDWIRTYSTGHSEAIATQDWSAAKEFEVAVDAAAVYVNASTAYTDGEQFGFGAEIGISTQKLHARGPMGLPELTSTKWVIYGEGHTRP